jgi:hypothetical protein
MITALLNCSDRTTTYIRGLVADLSDEEMILQPPGLPNHPAWTVGHVIHSYQAIAGTLGVSPWLPDTWELVFGYGSSPREAATSAHVSKEILMTRFADACDHLRVALLSIDERRLRDPLPDQASREVFASTADALIQIIAAHAAYHAGQLAAWRRAIGRAPVGIFV